MPSHRRRVLRGLLAGSAVTVGLPLLDCFLNGNATALADGAPLPVRFGTWFWGLGHQPGFGISDKGPAVELLREAAPLAAHKARMNYFSGFNAPLDGRANFVHYSGLIAARAGAAPSTDSDIPAPTIDTLVAGAIGGGTRFRSIDVSATGIRGTYSGQNSAAQNSAEVSVVALYARIFGPEFANPNKAEFKPDPTVMVRQSVLSGIDDQSKRFLKRVGAGDKARMDEYFTSIRELEHQLDMQLKKPPPNEACKVPTAPGELPLGAEMSTVMSANKVMGRILAMAMACDQTKVFTMTFSAAASNLHRAGEAYSHHMLSHEEPVDPKLGYQAAVSWFNQRSMEGLAAFVDAFAAIKEGDGTLLDHMLLFAHSDTNDARVHALDGIPVMTFGKAGGRIKTGIHVAGNGDPITRVGLTAMQVMGVPLDSWGTKSLQTSKPAHEILV